MSPDWIPNTIIIEFKRARITSNPYLGSSTYLGHKFEIPLNQVQFIAYTSFFVLYHFTSTYIGQDTMRSISLEGFIFISSMQAFYYHPKHEIMQYAQREARLPLELIEEVSRASAELAEQSIPSEKFKPYVLSSSTRSREAAKTQNS